ncbi:MAG: hypothetical protein ACREJB_08720 [Planctomycetaceae bacterium]
MSRLTHTFAFCAAITAMVGLAGCRGNGSHAHPHHSHSHGPMMVHPHHGGYVPLHEYSSPEGGYLVPTPDSSGGRHEGSYEEPHTVPPMETPGPPSPPTGWHSSPYIIGQPARPLRWHQRMGLGMRRMFGWE